MAHKCHITHKFATSHKFTTSHTNSLHHTQIHHITHQFAISNTNLSNLLCVFLVSRLEVNAGIFALECHGGRLSLTTADTDNVCSASVENINSSDTSSNKGIDEDALLFYYFRRGFSYEEILDFLGKYYGICMSKSTLLRGIP